RTSRSPTEAPRQAGNCRSKARKARPTRLHLICHRAVASLRKGSANIRARFDKMEPGTAGRQTPRRAVRTRVRRTEVAFTSKESEFRRPDAQMLNCFALNSA